MALSDVSPHHHDRSSKKDDDDDGNKLQHTPTKQRELFKREVYFFFRKTTHTHTCARERCTHKRHSNNAAPPRLVSLFLIGIAYTRTADCVLCNWLRCVYRSPPCLSSQNFSSTCLFLHFSLNGLTILDLASAAGSDDLRRLSGIVELGEAEISFKSASLRVGDLEM